MNSRNQKPTGQGGLRIHQYKVAEELTPEVLPVTGKSRWSGFKRFSPVCLGTFLTLSKKGRAPKAERLGSRCTFYDNKELHKWLSDPAGYIAGSSL